MNCPDCRSTEITLYMGGQFGKYLCKSCGYVGPLILEKDAKPIQIVVVGAGFGGLRTALLLKKRMKKEVSVTVIDKQRRHVFIPALMDYLAKMLHKDNITIELEPLLKRRKIQFLRVIVNSVNVHRKKVGMGSKCISYDYLVVAIGVETHAHNVLGVDKYAHAFRTIEDADRLRAAVKSLATSKKRMNIVIVGGGTTGVQLAAYLRTYADSTFPNRDIIITLIHSHKRLLNELPAKVGRQVEAYLQKMRANIILAARVSKVRKNKLYLTKNNAINADLIVWTAGVKISQQVQKFGLESVQKGIYVNKYLQAITSPEIFALGDCASFKNEDLDKHVVKRAQNANKQAVLVADNIIRSIQNKKMREYKPTDITTIIALPHNSLFHYKGLVIQGRLTSLLDSLIRLRHLFLIRYG